MIHTTHREILLRCDEPKCPEVDWLDPTADVVKWQTKNGWGTDGQSHYCACCVEAWRLVQ